MSRQLEDFFEQFRSQVPGCPGFVAEREVLFTAREFCEETGCWRHEDELVLSDGDSEYTLAEELYLPSQSEITGLVSARDDSENDYTAFSLDLDSGLWTEDDEPTESKTLTLNVTLRPTRSAGTLPDFLYNRHIEAIGNGAASRLLLQPKTDWFNTKLSEVRARQFRQAKAALLRRRNKGHRHQTLTVRMRTFM